MVEITAEYLASQGLSPTFPERFWAKVLKTGPIPTHRPELGPCWTWIGSKNPHGYGRIGSGGKYGEIILAHRSSWILHFGPIPDGRCILHKCDNTGCPNPEHLWYGTQADNLHDCIAKGRKNQINGTRVHTSKLTESDVGLIRQLYVKGSNSFGGPGLGKRFGVHRTQITAIMRRETWTHI